MQRALSIVTLEFDLDELLVLNRYTIEARYPGDWEPITREEAQEAVLIARKLRDGLRARFPRELLGR